MKSVGGMIAMRAKRQGDLDDVDVNGGTGAPVAVHDIVDRRTMQTAKRTESVVNA